MQDSYGLRALSSARMLAEKLITDQGRSHPFHGPLPSSDADILEHQENFLKKWNSDPVFVKKFHKFSLPLCHRRAEEMVRASVHAAENMPLTDVHVRRAALSACLTPLRQTIGSCFATAPAILVQRHHLDLFVDDVYELLTTGRLRRVVEGKAYTVPLSPVKISAHDEHPLLKAWEFTLASFCDVKTEFSKWNLAWSLGLDPRQEGGMGQALYRALDEGLQNANRKAEEFHGEAVAAFDQLKAVERALRQASSESEVRRYRSEEQARLHHMRSCEELRDQQQLKAAAYAKFLSFLIETYTQIFQDYFQEIYDPELAEESKEMYEDRKAGFRLVYKHGRSDSSLWTSIHTQEEFIRSLTDFLTITEPVISQSCESAEQKKILEEMTTVLIQHVQSPLFLQKALEKSTARSRTPWAYISGGTLEQWISIYFKTSSSPAQEKREVANAMELFVFLLDTLKALPHALSDQFLQDSSKRLLMESPTHVFSLLPGLPLFQQGWLDRGFTYTWIRDNFFLPTKQVYEETLLTEEEQERILRLLAIPGKPLPRSAIADFCHHFAKLEPLLPPFLHQFQSQAALQPCVFADTNWPEAYFTFVVSPLTLQIEVWKSDRTGRFAAPLPLITSWFGKGKEFAWTVYTRMV
jgi:hypothetical protein